MRGLVHVRQDATRGSMSRLRLHVPAHVQSLHVLGGAVPWLPRARPRGRLRVAVAVSTPAARAAEAFASPSLASAGAT